MIKSDGIPRLRVALEAGFVFVMVALYVTLEALQVPKRYTIVGLGVALALYAVYLFATTRERPRDFGLRLDNLGSAAVPAGIFTLVAAATVVAWASITGKPLWRSELAIMLPLYPLYGIAQQFVFQGVFHRRVRLALGSRAAAVPVTAVVFSLVHLPDFRLAGLTLAAGLAWSWMFSARPNVWVLGLSHGILAALVYPMILGENPLLRM